MERSWVLLYSAQRVLVDDGPASTAVMAFVRSVWPGPQCASIRAFAD